MNCSMLQSAHSHAKNACEWGPGERKQTLYYGTWRWPRQTVSEITLHASGCTLKYRQEPTNQRSSLSNREGTLRDLRRAWKSNKLALSARNSKRARHILGLRRRRGRRCPGSCISRKIKELAHIRHGCVARGKVWQMKPCFNQFERCRVIHGGVRNEVLLGER